MTVLTTASWEQKLGNGVTTSFPFSIVFGVNSDISVTRVRADGVRLPWTEGIQYNLTGAANPSGGTLTTTAGNTVASGESIVIDRQVPATQLVDLVPNSALPADTLELSLDKLTHLVQGLRTTDSRSLRLDPFDPASGLDYLPAKSTLADKFLAFDSNGDPIATTGAALGTSMPVSTYVESLLSAADAPGFRSLIHTGNMVPVTDHGAIGDGTTDDTAAFQAAINAAIAGDQIVLVPAGTWRMTGQLTGTNLRGIVGEGRNVSTLIWDDAVSCGISLEFDTYVHAFRAADLSLKQSGRGGTALLLDYSALDLTWPGVRDRFLVERVRIDGPWVELVDEPYDNGWDVGVDSIAGAYGKILDCEFFGFKAAAGGSSRSTPSAVGFRFRGTGPEYHNGHPVAVHVVRCQATMVQKGIVFDGCEGGYAMQNQLVEVDTGILFDGGDILRPQVVANANHINCYFFGIQAAGMVDGSIADNLIYRIHTATGDVIGVDITASFATPNTGWTTVTGNMFCETNATTNQMFGVRVGRAGGAGGTTGPGINIDNNMFRYVHTAILLEATSTGAVVGLDNRYGSVTTSVTDLGTGNIIARSSLVSDGSNRGPNGFETKWGDVIILLNASGDGTITYPSQFVAETLSATVSLGDPAYAPGQPVVNLAASSAAALAVSIRPNPGAVNIHLTYIAMGR